MESPLLDEERNRRPSLNEEVEKMSENNNDNDESVVIKKNKPTMKNSCNFLLFCLVLSLFFGVVSIILQQETNRHSSDFVDAAAELNKRIYGQDQAVKALSRYLLRDHPPLKVIAVVGGTGVGKSYTVEIVKQNFPRGYFVSQFFSPINSADGHFTLYPQLIVLENLRQHDLMSVKNFLKTLQMNESDRYITVIAVFNFEQMDDNATRSIDLNGSVQMLQNFFADEDIDAKVIPYHSLPVDALEKCIFDAMKNTGLELSAEQVDVVKQYLIRSNAGCKGAHAKVQLVGRHVDK